MGHVRRGHSSLDLAARDVLEVSNPHETGRGFFGHLASSIVGTHTRVHGGKAGVCVLGLC